MAGGASQGTPVSLKRQKKAMAASLKDEKKTMA